MNSQRGKDENYKYYLYNLLNKNGEYQENFLLKNSLSYLSTKIKKMFGLGNQWNHIYPIYVKAQLDYIITNKKWINSTVNCEAYSFFDGISSDHRIDLAKICLSFLRNKTIKFLPYDWCSLTNCDIRNP